MSQTNGSANGHGADSTVGSYKVKAGLAQMLKGGVIMDVVNAEQVSSSTSSASACSTRVQARYLFGN
jgi:pyridoxal 5'-phosphate synthase pdxS subunit